MTLREWHRTIALVAAIPFLITVLSGFAFRWSLDVFGIPDESVGWLMKVHQGSYLNSVVYTLLNGGLFLCLTYTGWTMWSAKKVKSNFNEWPPKTLRMLHFALSTLGLFLLSYFAITGAVYRFSRNVLAVDKQTIGWLLQFHQGEFVQSGSVVFTFIMLIVSIGLLVSGLSLHPRVRSALSS
eukprot:TRINITY_DN2253_c0_g1_i1.p1 TRINITY_DN2253_c0_g1~~TRINITY_DN2253_c0_g1_i1.p1  ORF type:complete len:191 (-),score=18.89 TRINITY_DN2253_c0_g1_i1:90-635(-)